MHTSLSTRDMRGGTHVSDEGTEFAIWSHHAEKIELCLFDENGEAELRRLTMERDGDGLHRRFVADAKPGLRYGYRVYGPYDPERGMWFDPSKLLVDPYATELDRAFVYDGCLSRFGEETSDLVPKTIVSKPAPTTREKPVFKAGGLIYEIAVRPFTMLHPEIAPHQRGTVAALAHPAVIDHLLHIGVDAVELMPITAWIDERHLPPLGLVNGWGYNPVAFMALDPRLVPGGIAELRDTVSALHSAGIGVILDLVFNHTGESDRFGPTLSLRGLDNLCCYRHVENDPATLVNDTGTGNTVACDHPYIRNLIVDSLRHFVDHAGVDGFRFDLAPVLGRSAEGFSSRSATLAAILEDDGLADRIMIAEPWDIGPGGYQLGNFPGRFLEWNDRCRDDLRRYWRGDAYVTGPLATALAGSSNIFDRNGHSTRSVNFLAAHDGFTLADLVSHAHKHNDANGEGNRDGHNDNHSWNNGAEGATADPAIIDNRRRDIKALLSTLFATRGSIMLTAGDEAGRSQQGNNNAYCQDNSITWMDWGALDADILAHTAALAALRNRFSVFGQTQFLTGQNGDVEWLNAQGEPMTVADWDNPDQSHLAMILKTEDRKTRRTTRLAVLFNRHRDRPVTFRLPVALKAGWHPAMPCSAADLTVGPRSVAFFVEG